MFVFIINTETQITVFCDFLIYLDYFTAADGAQNFLPALIGVYDKAWR